MKITAKMVQELRQMTGAGMMQCKEALVETDGDIDAAVDVLRKTGLKIADKKSGRDTNEGLVGIYMDDTQAVMAVVKSETDFVARSTDFQNFVTAVLTGGNQDATEVIAKLGENIQVGEIVQIPMESVLASYVHDKVKVTPTRLSSLVTPTMGRIGVVVSMTGDPSDELAALGNQIAMHITASNPRAISVDDLDPEFVAKEKEIFTAQALASGKPEHIVEKMVAGRMRKALGEVVLLDQPFVVDPDKTVGQALEEAQAAVVAFERFEIGE